MSFPIVVCNYNKRGGHTQEKTSKNIKKMIFLSGRFRVGAGTPCDQAPHTHTLLILINPHLNSKKSWDSYPSKITLNEKKIYQKI